MAAINNNPFEYWISTEEQGYIEMMDKVAAFIDDPKEGDIAVSEILTAERFQELKQLMEREGFSEISVEETSILYLKDYKDRKIVSEFLKDKDIGKKRLASMPDRITNTINVVQGEAYRPTVVNCYEEPLDSMDEWWSSWKSFMFDTTLQLQGGLDTQKSKPIKLLKPIKRSKYPAITPAEEAISLPLQTMALAIFDGILVHMMQNVAPSDWQPLRHKMCSALNKKKNDRVIEILTLAYHDSDIIFLQEVSGAFVSKAKETELGKRYAILVPEKMDSARDQNSAILIRTDLFNQNTIKEVTSEVSLLLTPSESKRDVPVADGDIFVVEIEDGDGQTYLLASFHGDTNGLATIPVVNAVHDYALRAHTRPRMVFGLDANTYEKGSTELGLQSMSEFVEDFTAHGIQSIWGPDPDPTSYTTFNARTYLQPQLNKALKSDEKSKGDINPKDFILFYENQMAATQSIKDNTGTKLYLEGEVFPTLEFPSDHGIISAKLTLLSET